MERKKSNTQRFGNGNFGYLVRMTAKKLLFTCFLIHDGNLATKGEYEMLIVGMNFEAASNGS